MQLSVCIRLVMEAAITIAVSVRSFEVYVLFGRLNRHVSAHSAGSLMSREKLDEKVFDH
jgi:hypothetical protein